MRNRPKSVICLVSLLIAILGAHVVVYVMRQPDGSLASERVSVGKNGMVPTS